MACNKDDLSQDVVTTDIAELPVASALTDEKVILRKHLESR